MTVADKLRKEGEILGVKRGVIRGKLLGQLTTYQELLANGYLSRELAEKKIAELNRELREVMAKNRGNTKR